MPFVKLDCGILDSTLWIDRECREVFITALLMAEPRELTEPTPQIAVHSTQETGWAIPPGWYGFIRAAGPGIVRRSLVDMEAGLAALERLGAPDPASRSAEFEGRRLIRVDGGYIVLNFMRYRERDETAAERARRYRQNKAIRDTANTRDSVTVTRDKDNPSQNRHGDTRKTSLAEAEADAEDINNPVKRSISSSNIPADPNRVAALRSVLQADGRVTLDAKTAMHLRQWASEGVTDQQLADAIAIARDRKPHPEIIPPGYLAPVVADVRSGSAARPRQSLEEAKADGLRRIEETERRERERDAERRALLEMGRASAA